MCVCLCCAAIARLLKGVIKESGADAPDPVQTAAQEEAWEDDPNAYVADEDDDMTTVRAACGMLLHQMSGAFGEEGELTSYLAAERAALEAGEAWDVPSHADSSGSEQGDPQLDRVLQHVDDDFEAQLLSRFWGHTKD